MRSMMASTWTPPPLNQPLIQHEQAEKAVLSGQLALGAGALMALSPEVLEIKSGPLNLDTVLTFGSEPAQCA